MKSLQKVTRVQLNINKTDESILLGIVSAEPDYKLSHTLNIKFRISLKNTSPVRITDNKGLELVFSRFSTSGSSHDNIFNLIANRSGKNYLFKKLKNVDYIIQIQEPDKIPNIDNITATLKEINTITAIFKIDRNAIKDKNLQYLIH